MQVSLKTVPKTEHTTCETQCEACELEKKDPFVCVRLLTSEPFELCHAVTKALFDAGLASNCWSEGKRAPDGSEGFNVNVFLRLENLPLERKE